jgi:hypothetical protein
LGKYRKADEHSQKHQKWMSNCAFFHDKLIKLNDKVKIFKKIFSANPKISLMFKVLCQI